jgi:hypothetical protein
MSEADFVVLWKGVVLILEVKGGRVRSEKGVWLFTDRFGLDHSRSESPWEQCRSAMFALRARVEKAIDQPRYEYSALVVMPDQEMGATVEWNANEFIGPSQLTVDGIARAFDSAARLERHGKSVSQMPSWGPLKKVLRPDFDRLPRLQEVGSRILNEMATIAEEQVLVLDAIESNLRLVVEGGAGSGKTLLAIEAARRAALAGDRVMFACGSEGVVRLASRMLEGSDVVVAQAPRLPNAEFDVLVVDEAQDLMNVDDLANLEGCLRGGFTAGRWWIFADPNNQAQVVGRFEPELYQGFKSPAAVFRLTKNHRNTKPMVEMVKSQLGADLGAPLIGAGPAVQFPRISDEVSAVEAFDTRVRQLREEGVDYADIHVVSLSARPSESLISRTELSLTGKITRFADDELAALWTPAEVKGLEADHVLVVDVDQVEGAQSLANLYVAMTRARVSLWVGLSNAARAGLERRVNEALAQERQKGSPQ